MGDTSAGEYFRYPTLCHCIDGNYNEQAIFFSSLIFRVIDGFVIISSFRQHAFHHRVFAMSFFYSIQVVTIFRGPYVSIRVLPANTFSFSVGHTSVGVGFHHGLLQHVTTIRAMFSFPSVYGLWVARAVPRTVASRGTGPTRAVGPNKFYSSFRQFPTGELWRCFCAGTDVGGCYSFSIDRSVSAPDVFTDATDSWSIAGQIPVSVLLALSHSVMVPTAYEHTTESIYIVFDQTHTSLAQFPREFFHPL